MWKRKRNSTFQEWCGHTSYAAQVVNLEWILRDWLISPKHRISTHSASQICSAIVSLGATPSSHYSLSRMDNGSVYGSTAADFKSALTQKSGLFKFHACKSFFRAVRDVIEAPLLTWWSSVFEWGTQETTREHKTHRTSADVVQNTPRTLQPGKNRTTREKRKRTKVRNVGASFICWCVVIVEIQSTPEKQNSFSLCHFVYHSGSVENPQLGEKGHFFAIEDNVASLFSAIVSSSQGRR